MAKTLHSCLEARLRTLRAQSDAGELLLIDDIFLNVTCALPTPVVLCLDGELPEGSDQPTSQSISPGLSFLWTADGLEKYGSGDRLERSVNAFLTENGGRLGRKIVSGSTYLFTPNDNETRDAIDALAACVNLIHQNSLNAFNKKQDEVDTLGRDLHRAVTGAKGLFGLTDLATFLHRATGLDFGLMHLSHSPVRPLGRAVTVSTGSSQTETRKELAEYLGLPPLTFVPETEEPAGSFPAVALSQNVGSELIVNAGTWGKPLASGLSLRSSRRIFIVPITRPQMDAGRPEALALAATELLFAFTDRLDLRLMTSVRACVDTFSAYRYGARRFNVLAGMQNQTAAALRKEFRPDDNERSDDLEQFREFLIPVINEILYTTSAHSVSVRLYNPRSRALDTIAMVQGSVEDAAEDYPAGIGLKGHERDSVVAFTFLNAGPLVPFVYLKRINPPRTHLVGDRIKTERRTFIPKVYGELGLEAPLQTRRFTRSELCFPLLKGSLPFGTLNLEAPFPAAFDQDIDYLSVVKNGIEQFYGASDQRVDGRWLIANAARSDAVHQLWQYQEEGSYFSEEQDRLLREIFPARSEHALVGRASLSSLVGRITSWITGRYQETLASQVLKMVKFDHLSDDPVDAYFTEAAFVVARNIIQNAVRHGEPAEDLLFIDDRPWFSVRRTPCLRIHYRSNQRIDAQVIAQLGAKPIQKGEGTRVAYGMYNVGLLTRLLGGSLYVTDGGRSARFTIEAHLPLPGGNDEAPESTVH